MSIYIRNRACPCQRCRARGLTGAAVLITVGTLFLLDNFNILDFERSWPVLLIAIGLTILAGRGASTEGHIQPYGAAPVAQPENPQVKP